MANETVMHPRRPSGTFATRIPIPKIMQVIISYPINKYDNKKKRTPKDSAIITMTIISLSNSILSGVLPTFSADTISAISPKVVLSPISMTIPVPYPSLQRVPKKATFYVSSKEFGWVQIVERG